MKTKSFIAAILLLIILAFVFWESIQAPTPVRLVPALTGEVEYCLTCHQDLPEISTSHPLESFGCVRCHGGERMALEADLAHSTMRGGKNPSSFDVVEESCGGEACHSGIAHEYRDHIPRVLTSIQATYSGAITHMLYSFGEQTENIAHYGAIPVQDMDGVSSSGITRLSPFSSEQFSNPMIQSFAENCLVCHLNAIPLEGQSYQRFRGCAACHSPLDGRAANSAQPTVHRLTLAIPYSQCNTCHNRGNYDLRLMEFVPRDDRPTDRLHDYYQPIAQFVRCEWTLDCIDCHTRLEVMGDGDIHTYQKDIQYIQCRTCHGTILEAPRTMIITNPDEIAFKLAFINPVIDLKLGDSIIVTERGEPLWNTRQLPDGQFELFAKATGQRFTFRQVMGTQCQQKPEEQESRYCHECHAVEK